LEEDPTVLNTLRKRLHGEEGFTLIELLVVILIIGILAAIAIPSFLNQKGKGEDSKAKADARTTQTALETYYTDNQNYSCGATSALCVTALKAIEAQVPNDAAATTTPGTVLVTQGTDAYSVKVWSTGERWFEIAKVTGGAVSRNCGIKTAGDNAGGCKLTAATTGNW
jgi:type IV pilus assembly protein PilA